MGIYLCCFTALISRQFLYILQICSCFKQIDSITILQSTKCNLLLLFHTTTQTVLNLTFSLFSLFLSPCLSIPKSQISLCLWLNKTKPKTSCKCNRKIINSSAFLCAFPASEGRFAFSAFKQTLNP